MLILTLKTDQPLAELALYDNDQLLAEEKWQAHRQLAETIHQKIAELLTKQKRTWADLEGIVCFRGPGSFTGLRIGLSVANALAEGTGAAIVGTEGVNWQEDGLAKLLAGKNDKIIVPEYGAEAHITQARK